MSKSKKQKKKKHKLKAKAQAVTAVQPSINASENPKPAALVTDALLSSDDADMRAAQPVYTATKYEPPEMSSSLRAHLGKLGKLLDKTLPKTTKSFHSVDLRQDEFELDAFHRQSSAALGLLFGKKTASVQSLASRFISSERLQSWHDKAFDTLAQWANQWVINELSKDSRFAKLSSLSELERVNFAKDISNQNRAMATLGGVSALAGLRGVLFDGVWLLLMSLRTIYQLAIIFEQPLTGSDGIKKAYGVLSGANLQRLQEKQIVLTALILAKHIFTQEQGITHGLKAVGAQYQVAEIYTAALSEASERLHLDQWNLRWLNKCLPAVSVATGAYYNAELIDEVIGTAMATFYPKAMQSLAHQTAEAPIQQTTASQNAVSQSEPELIKPQDTTQSANQAKAYGNLAEDT